MAEGHRRFSMDKHTTQRPGIDECLYVESEFDTKCMLAAVEEGEKGRRTAAPNPWVGCVIADDFGRNLANGYHKRAGTDRADV